MPARTAPRLFVAATLAVTLVACDTDDGVDTAAVVDDADEVVVTDEDDDTAVAVDDIDGLAVVEGSDEAAAALAEAVAATRAVDGRTAFTASIDGATVVDGVIGEGVSAENALQATMLVRGEVPALYGAADAEVEVRVVGGFVYLRWPALLAEAGFDEPWLSAPMGEGEPNVADLVDRARLASPAEALALLDGATAVARLDDETLDGLVTTHYVATVELGTARAVAGPAADLFAELEGNDDRALEVHAFVDEDGLVRRMEVAMDRDGTVLQLVVDVVELGTDATIEAPPAADVVTFAEYVAARS